MSGTDKITACLTEQTIAECEQIKAEARKKAEALIKASGDEARAQADKFVENARRQYDSSVKKAESAASLGVSRSLLSLKGEIIDNTVNAALKKLSNLDAASYFGVLLNLCSKQKLDGRGVMRLSAKDLANMPSDFEAKLGSDVTVSKEPADIENGFILDYGDIEINCAFDALARAEADELRFLISDILFSENHTAKER